MKLARKLANVLFLGVLAVLAVHAYIRISGEIVLFEGDMRRDAHVMGRVLSAAVVEVWRSDGPERALRLVADVNERESHVIIRYTPLAQPTGSADPWATPPQTWELLAQGQKAVRKVSRDDGDFVVTYVPVRVEGSVPGAISLAESLAGERQYIRRTILSTIVATAVVALVCWLLASIIGIWLVGRPMQALIDHARRVGAGDLRPSSSTRQHDEIGEMAREMNAMCERLLAAQARITAETGARITAMAQLRHADRLATVGKLASGIAHELGAPLQVISGRARMICDGEVPEAEVPANARILLEQAQRMAQTIRQLLDFARRRGPEKAPADLAALIAQTCEMIAPIADKRGVSIVRADDGAVRVSIDAEQIRQALANLILNGVQAMPGGGRLTVGVSTERARPPADLGGEESEHACIYVEDEGEGMTVETMEHIFEPFFTTKEVGEGTGLGLSVAWGIVREHGGWIDVRSTPGEGSRFSVFLPRGEEA